MGPDVFGLELLLEELSAPVISLEKQVKAALSFCSRRAFQLGLGLQTVEIA